MLAIVAATVLAASTPHAVTADRPPRRGCRTEQCRERVARRARIHRIFPFCNTWSCVRRVRAKRLRRAERHWLRVAAPHRAWLRKTSLCESGGDGWYGLRTTHNGFWFAFQFTPSTWASVGGRRTAAGPVGFQGELVPSKAEQDYRAVRVLHTQGRGAWPRCG